MLKQHLRVIVFVIVFFSITSLGCQAFSKFTSEPTSTAYPTSASDQYFNPEYISPPGSDTTSSEQGSTAKILYFDDFSNQNSGWDASTDDSGATGYAGDQYRISISTANYYYWSNPGLSYGDVIVEVEAQLENGSSQNDIGIICRLVDNNNFYFLTVSSDGYYQISKFIDGEEEFVGMNEYGFNSDAIKEDVTNLVRAECVGDELALFANNIELARANDSDFQEGDVGLIAGTYDEPGLSVLFDNFTVYAP